ncbi:type I restriction enzyme HsdR N-terminal domain-containing protein [Methanobrevibacter sp.]|uniref:type I restriction enzyme HsdR N-terminal domain-containing protein n=1 Tax=Methanobrevibacter sp. TaxID=66852 RepID=UPI0026DFC3B4|nr:type I restriction enzyme HsdR N-terminal domain-containing protein [Methanobrevibacter sp.]
MTFENQILDFSKNITNKKRGISTEETTKISLVLPFLKILEYDVENPHELKAEYVADTGVRKREKIDLAVFIDNEVKILIECKSANTKLNSNHLSQLYRYFSVSDVKFVVLTNGIVYQFFTDSKNPGRMDQNPFLEVDLRKLTDEKIESLKLFTKSRFSQEKILEHVEELKYRHEIHNILLNEIRYPSDELIRVFAKKIYSGNLDKKQMKYFHKIIKDELKDVFENDYELGSSEIITTEEEIQGFYIVRAIVSEIINPDKITMKDRKSYCAIFFDDNKNYTICRLYFNDLDNLAIAFFDSMDKDKYGSRIGEIMPINNINDIYNYKDKLLDTVSAYKKIFKLK